MKRRTKTILLLLGAAALFLLVLVGQLAQLGNWFGLVLMALMGLLLWAAWKHWPHVFDVVYGGGSVEKAEQDVHGEDEEE